MVSLILQQHPRLLYYVHRNTTRRFNFRSARLGFYREGADPAEDFVLIFRRNFRFSAIALEIDYVVETTL